jgi:hypothetical protein
MKPFVRLFPDLEFTRRLLFPQKQTFGDATVISAMGQ